MSDQSPATSLPPRLPAPRAERRPHQTQWHGITLEDPYGWLRAKNWQEVMREPDKLDADIRHLIHRMARDNPTWGRRRIRAELALLGYDVAEPVPANVRTALRKKYGQE